MSTISIICPDPAESKMLALSFELSGMSVTTDAPTKQTPADILIMDVINNNSAEWKETEGLIKKCLAGSTVLILPYGRLDPPKGIDADLIIRRPFELLSVVSAIGSLKPAQTSPSEAKKKKPPQTIKKPKSR